MTEDEFLTQPEAQSGSESTPAEPEMSGDLPELPVLPPITDETGERNTTPIVIAVAFTIIFIALIVSIIFMLRSPAQTETLRDIMIILLAVEFMFIGIALVILIVQLAKLTALIQNEVAPMLESSSEALNYLRGTTVFMSEHLVNPVIEANSKLASFRRGLGSLFTTRNR